MPLTPVTWLNDFVVNLTTDGNQLNPRIIQLANGNILVVWDSDDNTGAGAELGVDVIGQLFNPLGHPVGEEFSVNADFFSNNEGNADIATLPGGGFLSVFEDNDGVTSSIRLTRRDADGSNPIAVDIANDITSNDDESYFDPRIAVGSETSALIIYRVEEAGSTESRIVGRIYDSVTNTVGSEISVINLIGTNVDPDIAVLTNGNYVIAAASNSGGNQSISVRMINAAGGNQLGVFKVADTDSNSLADMTPTVTALTGGGYVITWNTFGPDEFQQTVRAQVFSSAGVAQGDTINVISTSSSGLDDYDPAVVELADGGFLVLFDNGDLNSFQGLRYDSAGVQVGDTFTIASSINVEDIDAKLLADGRVAVSFRDIIGEIRMEILDIRDEANATGVYGPPDWQIGTVGNDTITSDGDVFFVAGHDGDDVINTAGPAATYYGGAGNDTINVDLSGDAGDVFNGGDGIDTADFTNSFMDGAVFDLNTGTVTVNSDGLVREMIGFETLIGTVGNDQITGNSADPNQLDGGDGDDTINGGGDDDNIFGGTGNDALQGSFGTDAVFGGEGDDAFRYLEGTGYDNIYGGTETDSMVFEPFFGDNLTIDMDLGTFSTGGPAFDFVDMENVTTTTGSDSVLGNQAGNVISLGEGGDHADGGNGADTLNGEAGKDTLLGGAGTDTLNGGADDDTLEGGSGEDDLTGSDGNDLLTGDTGNDSLFGGLDSDTLNGGDDDDQLDGGLGSDALFGGDGNDDFGVLRESTGLDQVYGGVGSDKASFADTTEAVNINLSSSFYRIGLAQFDFFQIETVISGSGDDLIVSDVATASINAGAGNDVVQLTDLTVAAHGGIGRDKLNLSGIAGNQSIALGTNAFLTGFEDLVLGTGNDTGSGTTGANDISGRDGNDRLSGLGGDDKLFGEAGQDNLDGGGGNDQLTGGSGNDSLTGGTGDDTIFSGLGNDTIFGGTGNDSLVGGAGLDLVTYFASAAGVTVNLTTGQGAGGAAQGDVLADIENVIGSAKNDNLTGNGGANSLNGGLGADSLTGGGGKDTLTGGDGVDTLIGGAGADALAGGADVDLVSYAASATAVSVNLTSGAGLGGDAQGDTLNSVENLLGSSQNDTLTGNALDNALTGGQGADSLNGAGGADLLAGNLGNDTLSGGAGADTLVGGTGADALVGGAGVDLASYATSAVGVRVSLTSGAGTGGDAQGDTLTGIENLTGSGSADRLTGSTADNILTGMAGSDSLTGSGGNDTLRGGFGADTLDGGAGADVFVFDTTSGAGNIDVIRNYSVASDVIALDDAVFDGLTAGAALSTLAFAANNTGLAVRTTDHIIYQKTTGRLFFDVDGFGGDAGVQFATVTPNLVNFGFQEFFIT